LEVMETRDVVGGGGWEVGRTCVISVAVNMGLCEGMKRVSPGGGILAKQEGRGGPMRVQMQMQMVRVLYLPSTVAADAQ